MVVAGIVAGGTGSRMGQNVMPKQFLEVAKKPIVIHTIEKFMASPAIDYIVVGVHREWEHVMKDLVKKYFNDDERIAITVGGATRNDTIKNIVDAAKENFKADADTVMVTHDAVRPFVTEIIGTFSLRIGRISSLYHSTPKLLTPQIIKSAPSIAFLTSSI